jgi:hypothetical protein
MILPCHTASTVASPCTPFIHLPTGPGPLKGLDAVLPVKKELSSGICRCDVRDDV